MNNLHSTEKMGQEITQFIVKKKVLIWYICDKLHFALF